MAQSRKEHQRVGGSLSCVFSANRRWSMGGQRRAATINIGWCGLRQECALATCMQSTHCFLLGAATGMTSGLSVPFHVRAPAKKEERRRGSAASSTRARVRKPTRRSDLPCQPRRLSGFLRLLPFPLHPRGGLRS